MKNPKPEFRSPKEFRYPNSAISAETAQRALECGGKRSATPLLHAQGFSHHLKPSCARKRRRRFALPAHSKAWRILVASLIFLAAILTTHAQSFSIDWFKIAGGGGTSTGNVYSVSGTIGQPDASGPMTGGNYSLTGGFWPGIAVPSTTGGPTLFIQFVGSSVIVSWSPATPGFVLEETTSLDSPSWPPAPSGNPTAPIPATGQAKFYRLRQP